MKAPNYDRGLLIVSVITLTVLAAPFGLFWLFLWAACVFGRDCV